MPEDATLAQFSLRWILDHDAVSTVIPGSTNPDHIRENVIAASLPPLTGEEIDRTRRIYEEHVADAVHQRW